MRNKKMIKAILVFAATIMLAGCSQSKQEESSSSDTLIESQPLAESQSQTQSINSQDEGKQLSATVTVNCAYVNGAPDIVEVMEMKDVIDQPEENGHTICGYDAAGNLVYKRDDSSFTDDKGIQNVTITYEIYSLEHDFDFRIDPLEPDNGGNIQTLNGTVVIKSESGETSKDFTFETVGIRGQTGIWYAGICSCRDGVLGDYVAR